MDKPITVKIMNTVICINHVAISKRSVVLLMIRATILINQIIARRSLKDFNFFITSLKTSP